MTSFIKYPEIGGKEEFFSYDNIEVTNNLTINRNLNIQGGLSIQSIHISNNATFLGNIDVKNYNLSVKKNCTVFGNIYSRNTILYLHNNLNCNNFNFKTERINSSLKIDNNINVKANLNTGTLLFKKNCNILNDTIITDSIVVKNNLNSIKYNIISKNTFINKEFTINKTVNLDYLIIKENFNLSGNLSTLNILILNELKIQNNFNIKNGTCSIGNNQNLTKTAQMTLNSVSNCIDFKLKNNIIRLNDFHETNYKSNLNLYDNNHIDINILNDKILHISNNDLNLNYNIFKNNLNANNTINITNNANIFHNINSYNNIFINKGIIELPSQNNKRHIGSICYNQNTDKINIIKNNKWDELNFLDQYDTGIINNNNNLFIKIKNNNIFTLENNINILNNCFFTYNTYVTHNTNIKNNLNLSKIIHINNIPIEYYRNILRTYNSDLKKWYSLTLQKFDLQYYDYYQSNNFYLHVITNSFKYCNTVNNLDYNTVLINNHDLYYKEKFLKKVYLTHIFFNIINYKNNVIICNLYKNDILCDKISINSNLSLLELNKTLIFNTNDILSIKIKSNDNYHQSILLNLLGYSLTDITLKGDSNFLTDTEIFMNQNTYFNVNTCFHENMNISNINLKTNKNILNTPSLFIYNKSDLNSLLQIGDIFYINKNSNITVGSNNIINNSLITINNDENKNTLINYGGLALKSNLNIEKSCYLNNVNIINNINTDSLHIKVNTNLDIKLIENININSAFIQNNLNLLDDSNNYNFIQTKNLLLSNYNNNYNKNLLNNSLYLSCSNNSNLSLIHNINSNNKYYIYHSKINQNNNIFNFNNTILINQDNVSILSNNTNNIFNVKDDFLIKMNGSIHINNDLIIKNINYTKKIKSLLYDIYN